jgi:hypothetical protein
MVFCVRLLVSGQLGAGFERFATKIAAVVSFCPMNGGHMVVERRVGFESGSEKLNRYCFCNAFKRSTKFNLNIFTFHDFIAKKQVWSEKITVCHAALLSGR